MSSSVISADGTTIAYDEVGSGPRLILVDAAGHYRGFSSFAGLVDRLANDFTVFHVDRRGRGESTDTEPYAVQHEIDDIAALIDRAGGRIGVPLRLLLRRPARAARRQRRAEHPQAGDPGTADRAGRGPHCSAGLHG